jgi:hypothetical protein
MWWLLIWAGDTIGLEPNEVGKIKVPAAVAKAQEYTERFVKKWVSGEFLQILGIITR